MWQCIKFYSLKNNKYISSMSNENYIWINLLTQISKNINKIFVLCKIEISR